MKWNYVCPICSEWRQIDWEVRSKLHTCHKHKKSYYPPGPADQNHAFVDTHNWPVEMENEVVRVKGNKCTTPNCNKNAETLDHRDAYANGGKTSVDNLFPMCEDCNQSKGDKDYLLWLRGY